MDLPMDQFMEEDFLEFLNTFGRPSGSPSRIEQHPNIKNRILHIKVDGIETQLSDLMEPNLFSFARSMSCNITVDEKTISTPLSKFQQLPTNAGGILKPGVGEKKDSIWELLEYYGPTKVSFQIVEKGFFRQTVLAEGFLPLGSLMRQQDRAYQLLKKRAKKDDESFSPINLDSAIKASQAVGKRWGIESVFCVAAKKINSSGLSEKANGSSTNKPSMSICGKINVVESEFKIKFRFRLINVTNCYQLDNILCTSPFGQSNSELHMAVESGCVVLVELMLYTLGQNSLLRTALSLKNSAGYNAFCIALLTKNKAIVKLMLKRCGLWCFQDTGANQSSALHCAVESGCPKCLLMTLRFMIRYRNDIVGWSSVLGDMIEWKDPMANTPLATACMKTNNIDIIRILLRVGASVTSPNIVTQRTVFMHACEVGNLEAVTVLLDMVKTRQEINRERANGARGHVDDRNVPRASYLSRLKCRPTEKDASGITALMLAVENKHVEIVRILLRLRLSLLGRSNNGNGIFHYACLGGSREVCELLVQYESQQWRHYKDHIRRKSTLKSMYHRPQTMLIRNHRGQQPHQIALEKGFNDLAQYIIKMAKTIYSDKATGLQHSNLDYENAAAFYDEHLDDMEYEFAVTKSAQGPNNYYATLAIMNSKEESPANELSEPAPVSPEIGQIVEGN